MPFCYARHLLIHMQFSFNYAIFCISDIDKQLTAVGDIGRLIELHGKPIFGGSYRGNHLIKNAVKHIMDPMFQSIIRK